MCLKFLDFIAEDSPDLEQNVRTYHDIKNLACAVTLKEELANLMGEMFAKAVTAILENNGNSQVTHELSGSFNEMGKKLFEKHLFRSDETMEQLKAVQSANYIRFMEANPSVSRTDDDNNARSVCEDDRRCRFTWLCLRTQNFSRALRCERHSLSGEKW